MSIDQRITWALLAGLTLLSQAGCLSLGSTTYEMDSPRTAARVSALETRVEHLEQALGGTSQSPPPVYTSPAPAGVSGTISAP